MQDARKAKKMHAEFAGVVMHASRDAAPRAQTLWSTLVKLPLRRRGQVRNININLAGVGVVLIGLQASGEGPALRRALPRSQASAWSLPLPRSTRICALLCFHQAVRLLSFWTHSCTLLHFLNFGCLPQNKTSSVNPIPVSIWQTALLNPVGTLVSKTMLGAANAPYAAPQPGGTLMSLDVFSLQVGRGHVKGNRKERSPRLLGCFCVHAAV
jgi:hypothetical protein